MKKIFILSYILCFSFVLHAQQEYSMHFLRDVWNSNYTNPGLAPRQTFFIGGLSAGGSLSIKGLGNTAVFVEQSDGIYSPNFQEIIDNVDEDLRIRGNAVAEEFGIGFKIKKFFISFNTATKVSVQVNLPKNIFELAWRGNEPFIGETVEFGPSFSIDAYQELGLGVNYSFNRKLSAGIRVKRLIGIMSAFTSSDELSLSTGTNHYETSINTNYVANISTSFLNIVAPEDGQILNTEGSVDEIALDEIIQNYNLPSGNSGWGVDLGVSMNLKDRFELGLSVLDLGYINYNTGVSGLQSSGSFNFDGLSFSEAVNGSTISFAPVLDSLSSLLSIQDVPGTTFRKELAPKIYLSGLFKYGFWELGGMFYNEFSNDGLVSSIGLSGRYVLDNRFSLGAVYAYHDGRFDNIGVNGTMRLGPLQLHVLVDNIFPLFKPERLEYTNVRAGLNIVFGSKKMRKFRKGRKDKIKPPTPPNAETR